MNENMIMVENATDNTIVIDIPELAIHRTWRKRGVQYPFERSTLMQAYYDPAVEYLFRKGMLITKDKQFLKDVGLMDEDGATEIFELTSLVMARMIQIMPLSELKETLSKLSRPQLSDLADYAIEHNANLAFDRVDILSKATGRNILKAIELNKAAKED